MTSRAKVAWSDPDGVPFGGLITGIDPDAVMEARPGPVRALALGSFAGRLVVALAGFDGTVRLWEPAAGPEAFDPLPEVDEVVSMAFGQVDAVAGRGVLALGRADGTVRLWDLVDGRWFGEPLTGHVGAVPAVAFGQVDTSQGRVVLASAGMDGTLCLWDPAAGLLRREPIVIPPATVAALGFEPAEVGDGRLVLALVDVEGAARLLDPVDGGDVGEPSAGRLAGARSLALGQVGGRLVLAAGRDDGTVGLWDSVDGRAWPGALPRHRGPVLAVACAQLGGLPVLASAGEDGVVRLGSAAAGASDPDDPATVAADGGRPVGERPTGRRAIVSADSIAVTDVLGRAALAGHLVGVLGQLVGDRGAGDHSAGSVVVSVDGRWGSGKSVLAKLLVERMAAPRRRGATGGSAVPPPLRDPLVVWFDAWQESMLGPEWWLLAAAINRRVRGERAFVTRLWMTVCGWIRRLVRARSVIAALVVTLALVLAARLFAPDGSGTGIDDLLETLTKVLAAVSSVAAFALMIGKGLFWTSPVAGRLALRADDNPLREIIDVVDQLRHWSPRAGAHRLADTLLAIGLLVPAAVVVLALVRHDPSSVLACPGQRTPASEAGCWLTSTPGLTLAAALAAVSLTAYGWWVRRTRDRPRRPVLLVLDDIDRCHEGQAVRYLETVHTLLRHRTIPRFLPRWRVAAPLVVLVLGDGRWIRAAFTKEYETFSRLGDETRSLGADFLQKLFDHTILVPELTPDQAGLFLDVVTESPPEPMSEQRRPGGSATVPDAGSGTPGADPGRSNRGAGEVQDPVQVMHELTERRVREAQTRAGEQAAEERTRHLLAAYPLLMPSNPRLIRRVVNEWTMLEELRIHLGHSHDDETVIRAAVFLVRFPGLVETLTETARPISAEDIERGVGDAAADGRWARPDVLEVLRRHDGALIEPRSLGECFGRHYPPAPGSSAG